ncbi:MAG: OPT/YSL family transporter [Deltaproteobacteria bacterium]|nr:OPT/YSL family transporter [Deltaproteobacteria bacterium]
MAKDDSKLRLDVDPRTAATEDPEERWLSETYRPKEPNLTLRGVVVGVLIGAVMCLSNLYVFFKTGWSLGVTLTACILAFGVFEALRKARLVRTPLGPLENNALTTVASGAGYMTAGGNMAAYGALLMVLVPPMLTPELWNALEGTFFLDRNPKESLPSTPQMMLWFAVIAAMGVFVAIPIKRQLINREALPFPTGTATAETITTIHAGKEGSGKLRGLLYAALAGAGIKTLVSIFKILPDKLALPVSVAGSSLASWSIYLKTEVVLLAAGALMSFRTGWSLLVGGLATYGILAPVLESHGWIAEVSYKEIAKWTVWPGAAILVSAGLVSFALDYKALGRSFSGLGKLVRRDGGTAQPEEHGIAAVESPGWWFPAGYFLLAPAIILLMGWLFGIPWWAGVIAVVLAVLMGFIASRVTGETDITPTKALGPVTQITFGAVTPGNINGNIMSANVTGGIGLHAADLLTTLKTGWLLGARPRHQVYAQLVGVVAGAMFIVPAFKILIPDPAVLGDTEWPAPSCLVWESISRTLVNGLDALHDSAKVATLIGVVLGTSLAILERYAPARIKRFVPSANGLGIAMVVPAANSISMFLGALVAHRMQHHRHQGMVVPVASGLIAGESLMGIVVALLVGAGIVAQ